MDEDMQNIIMRIPKNAVGIQCYLTVIDADGETQKYLAKFDPAAIFEMRKNFLDYVGDDDYDTRYVLTEEGLKYLEELEKNVND